MARVRKPRGRRRSRWGSYVNALQGGYAMYQGARSALKNNRNNKLRQRQRQKPKNHWTVNQTETKLKRKPIQSPATGLSNSKTTLRYKMMKGAKNLLQLAPKDVFVGATTGFLQSPYNLQVTRSDANLTNTEIIGFYEKSADTQANYENTVDFLNNQSNERRFWLDSYYKEMLITNQSPSMVKMTIWDVVAREDTNTDPIASWVDGVVAESGTDAIQNVDTIGARPTDVKEFNRTWKVVNVRQIELGTGRCHQHVFQHSYNGWIPLGKCRNANSTVYLAGISSFQLIQTQGVPADNQNSWQSYSTIPTVAPPAIGIDRTKCVWVSSVRVRTRLMNVKSKKTTYSVQLGNISEAAYVQEENSTGVLNTALDAVFS